MANTSIQSFLDTLRDDETTITFHFANNNASVAGKIIDMLYQYPDAKYDDDAPDYILVADGNERHLVRQRTISSYSWVETNNGEG
jgi:hypothetical protein